MQHLRAVNDDENSKRGGVDEDDDTEAVWVPTVKPKEKPKSGTALTLKEEADPTLMLPASAFAAQERPLDEHYAAQQQPHGLQPDMDPHLRQTLEALDDEEFVDDDLQDDFFADLIQEGEWDGTRTAEDAWRDEAPEGDDIWLDPVQRALKERDAHGGDETALSLEARVALFKHAQKQQASDDETYSDEERDALGMPGPAVRAATKSRRAGSVSSSGSALGAKGAPGERARRAASMREGSVGSGWSMTSSSMFRNQGLTELDDRFDRVIRAYGGRATGDAELDALTGAFTDMPLDDGDEDGDELDHETAEKLTRQDFDQIMDEFLDHQEVIGGKLKPTLGDRHTTADEKLDMVRKALGDARIVEGDDVSTPEHENPFLHPEILRRDREQWDVETIRTTKTNLENHPRTIAAGSIAGSAAGRSSTAALGPKVFGDDVRIPKIRLHPRTGMPQVVGYTVARSDRAPAAAAPVEDECESSDASDAPEAAAPLKRDRNESKEARRARKEAQKSLKQQRRTTKAASKKTYSDERKRQLHASQRQAEARGGVAGMHLA